MQKLREDYVNSIRKQFAYYKLLGEKTFAQLDEEQIFTINAEDNSIGILVNHLSGNMLSRWTNFLTSDGEKTWRNRDREFENVLQNKADLLTAWNRGWTVLFEAIDSVDDNNFNQLVYIRNMGHTVMEAFNRQLAHYAYHIGQIVFIGKQLKAEKWNSLSIPKGNSDDYNKQKFNQEKRRAHFTDEYLTDKNSNK